MQELARELSLLNHNIIVLSQSEQTQVKEQHVLNMKSSRGQLSTLQKSICTLNAFFAPIGWSRVLRRIWLVVNHFLTKSLEVNGGPGVRVLMNETENGGQVL